MQDKNKQTGHEHETELERGSLIIVYGSNVVNDIPGTLKSEYAAKEPTEWKFRFGVRIGLNYLIEYGLNRQQARRLWLWLGTWLRNDPQRGEYIDYQIIPGPT